MLKNFFKLLSSLLLAVFLITNILFTTMMPLKNVAAGSYDGHDLAVAILANSSWLIDSSYTDTDQNGHRQAAVLTSLGVMSPTNGDDFALFSTGIAGAMPVTTDQQNPGNERGTWFSGGQNGYPRDEATLTMTLQVPPYMHYLYYDVQFFSAEYPEWVGTQYNDKLTITVNSPSKGVSQYVFDVNSGYFVLDSNSIPGTGFDIFAQSGNPDNVDWVDTTPRTPGADAGASDLIPIGGETHPVSPNEQITVTIDIKDTGDNLFDSAAFIDNLMFTGWAKTEIVARKTYNDLNGGYVECEDIIKYTVTISNTGGADQNDNPGNEFEDPLPPNVTYVNESATATSGVITYDSDNNKIIWNGQVPSESSVSLSFEIKINQGLENGTIISNQGIVNWDSDEDGINDATELTDDPYVDDGVDQDGDGDTADDDPTNLTVISFEPPSYVIEDFTDDTDGGKATESYMGRQWFETTQNTSAGSNFEVTDSYFYSTNNAFKTKIRNMSGDSYQWIYNFSALESQPTSWETWFTCGNTSGPYNMTITLYDDMSREIAKIKIEYAHEGNQPPLDWVAKLYYKSPTTGWNQLYSDYSNGALYNDWYKIKIEKNGNFLNYSLNRTGQGVVDKITDNPLTGSMLDLKTAVFNCETKPVNCPVFFWDEHKITLI